MRIRRVGLCLGVVAGVAGCTKIPNVAAPPVVLAVFDPTTNSVPTPNDLARSGGQVAITPWAGAPAAEQELERSMNGYDGFSVGSAPEVHFTGPISAASFSGTTVYAFDLGAGGQATPTPFGAQLQYSDCGQSLSFVAPTGYAPGHQYLFAVRGGANGIQGANGELVDASPAFYFLRSGVDLRQHPDAFPGATRAERQAAADALEAVREKYEPLFQFLESQGLPRREVAVMWTFTAMDTGEIWFDPGSQQIPMPNDVVRDPTTGLVSLPLSPTDSADVKNIKLGVSKLDGFSLTAPVTFAASAPVDQSTVIAGKTVRLFERATGTEITDLTATVRPDNVSIDLQPNHPLLPATSYVAVLAGVKDAQGNLLSSMPLGTLLKLKSPLVAPDGSSNVTAICGSTAAMLEPLRQEIAPTLDALEAAGVPRSEVAAAVTFKTQDIVKRFEALYTTPYTANLPLSVSNVATTSPSAVGIYNMSDVSQIITGTMTTLDFLDPVTRDFRTDGQGVPRQIQFVLTLPASATTDQPVPVVVFGQGLTTERRLGLFVAESLAAAGYAMMAIDFPLHGERTECIYDSDCSSGTCAPDGTCWDNGQQVDLARQSNSWPGLGPGTPKGSGGSMPPMGGVSLPISGGIGPKAFVDVEDLFGARDHFRQSIIDLSAQSRLLAQMDWKPVTGGYALDGKKIRYAGISLGGILGGTMAGIDPHYTSMALNVPGAGLAQMMQESAVFSQIINLGLQQKGIAQGSPQYYAFVNAAKWVFDEVDPINISRFAIRAPLSGAAPKRILIQEAVGDLIVSNQSTVRLETESGIDPSFFHQYYPPYDVHGFLAYDQNAQNDLVTFLEAEP